MSYLDIETNNLKEVIKGVLKDDPEYQRLIKTYGEGCLSSQLLIENVIREVNLWLKTGYEEEKNQIKEINRTDPPKNGRMIGQVPAIFERLLEHKIGRGLTPQERLQLLKRHKEWWTVDTL